MITHAAVEADGLLVRRLYLEKNKWGRKGRNRSKYDPVERGLEYTRIQNRHLKASCSFAISSIPSDVAITEPSEYGVKYLKVILAIAPAAGIFIIITHNFWRCCLPMSWWLSRKCQLLKILFHKNDPRSRDRWQWGLEMNNLSNISSPLSNQL